MEAPWGPQECDCKVLAVCPQTGEHTASQKSVFGKLLSMVSQMPSFRKGFQTHTPKKEKGSFERWDLRRGSDSWAQREMTRQ